MAVREDSRPDLDNILAEMIARAAARFGPRHKADWTIAPVLAERDDFPTTLLDERQRRITVHVTRPAAASLDEARYQLGHEAVHCLLASGMRETIYFEEGLANWFALSLTELPRKFRRQARQRLPPVLARPLLAFEALRPFDDRIRNFRAEVPDIEQLTKEAVEKHFKAPPAVAERLLARTPFERPDRM